MDGPIDLTLKPSPPSRAMEEGLQVAWAMRDRERQIRLQKQFDADMDAARADPSPENLQRLMLSNPSMKGGLATHLGNLDKQRRENLGNQALTVYNALRIGDKDTASRVLEDQISGARAASVDSSAMERVRDAIANNDLPNALFFSGSAAAGLLGDKFTGYTKEQRAQRGEKAEEYDIIDGQYVKRDPTSGEPATPVPGFVQQDPAREDYQVSPTTGQLLPKDPGKPAVDIPGWKPAPERSTTDPDSLAARQEANRLREEELKFEKEKIPPGLVKIVDEAQSLVNESESTAFRLESFANRYADSKLAGGITAKGAEAFKKLFGTQDENSAMRQASIKIINSEALANLPKGAASDADLMFAINSEPDALGNPEEIAQYMRGLAKAARWTAAFEQLRADMIEKNRRHSFGLTNEWRRTVDGDRTVGDIYYESFQKGLIPREYLLDIEKARPGATPAPTSATPAPTATPGTVVSARVVGG